MRWAYRAALMFAAANLAIASPSFAAFTSIGAPATGEDSQLQVLSEMYGGTFAPTSPGSLDYTNNSGITATRIEDTSSDLNPTIITQQPDAGPVGGNDQLWQGAFQSFTATAIFGIYDQTFGYFDGASGGTYHELLAPTGTNYNLSDNINLSTIVNLTGPDGAEDFRWARGGENRMFTSQNSDNPQSKDHLITYAVTGLNDGFKTWVLMWEDELPQYSDYDYNDLVVEIKALSATDVPEPAMLAPLGIGLLLSRRARRANKRSR